MLAHLLMGGRILCMRMKAERPFLVCSFCRSSSPYMLLPPPSLWGFSTKRSGSCRACCSTAAVSGSSRSSKPQSPTLHTLRLQARLSQQLQHLQIKAWTHLLMDKTLVFAFHAQLLWPKPLHLVGNVEVTKDQRLHRTNLQMSGACFVVVMSNKHTYVSIVRMLWRLVHQHCCLKYAGDCFSLSLFASNSIEVFTTSSPVIQVVAVQLL